MVELDLLIGMLRNIELTPERYQSLVRVLSMMLEIDEHLANQAIKRAFADAGPADAAP